MALTEATSPEKAIAPAPVNKGGTSSDRLRHW